MEVSRADRSKKIDVLHDLKRLVDGALVYLEADGLLVTDRHGQPMAYDLVLGGRFGIIDIQERERMETEWRGKKRYPRFRGVKNLQRLFAASYE